MTGSHKDEAHPERLSLLHNRTARFPVFEDIGHHVHAAIAGNLLRPVHNFLSLILSGDILVLHSVSQGNLNDAYQ
ncbi:MAG: hypothetical protein ACD_62C00279G0002 [uncultured bacterium]|nr:MAG: hypothetical protein ACD_62C00279G0002 [uncultured bacterium]